MIIKYREVVYASSFIAVGTPENKSFDARIKADIARAKLPRLVIESSLVLDSKRIQFPFEGLVIHVDRPHKWFSVLN